MALPIPHSLLWCRKRSGFTQAEAAWLLGFRSGTSVTTHELGQGSLTLDGALAYEALYGIAVADLFTERKAELVEIIMRRARSLKRSLRSRGELTERKERSLEGVGSNPRIPMMPL